MRAAFVVVALVCVGGSTVGCNGRVTSLPASDTGARDASPSDATTDASLDAFVTLDASVTPDAFVPRDAPALDAFVARDAFVGRDAFMPDAFVAPDAFAPPDAGHDAGRDAGSDAGTPSDAGTDRALECVASVPGTETMSGMVLSPAFWVGFRFEITAATTLTGVGLTLVPDAGASGTVLAGVVRLTGSGDGPDTPNLVGADVVATTLVPVTAAGGANVRASAPLSAPLPAGWYALEIGIGGGATLPGATVHSNLGGTGCTLPGSSFPFSIRQSDGMLILQGASPNLFVTVAP